MPKPMLSASLTLYETAGLTLIVLISDEIPWKRPIQSGEYSVFKPNGTVSPTPKLHCGPKSMAKNAVGTTAVSPASPPLLPRGRPSGATLPLLENSVDGVITEAAIAKCLPLASRAMPAGFHHTVVESSATAAAPAYALPSPLTPCS